MNYEAPKELITLFKTGMSHLTDDSDSPNIGDFDFVIQLLNIMDNQPPARLSSALTTAFLTLAEQFPNVAITSIALMLEQMELPEGFKDELNPAA